MRGTVARRYAHTHTEGDPLALAVAAVANWLSDQRLELQWFIAGQKNKAPST